MAAAQPLTDKKVLRAFSSGPGAAARPSLPLLGLLLPAFQAFALSAFRILPSSDPLLPAFKAFARSAFHSLPQPAAQPPSSAAYHFTERLFPLLR